MKDRGTLPQYHLTPPNSISLKTRVEKEFSREQLSRNYYKNPHLFVNKFFFSIQKHLQSSWIKANI